MSTIISSLVVVALQFLRPSILCINIPFKLQVINLFIHLFVLSIQLFLFYHFISFLNTFWDCRLVLIHIKLDIQWNFHFEYWSLGFKGRVRASKAAFLYSTCRYICQCTTQHSSVHLPLVVKGLTLVTGKHVHGSAKRGGQTKAGRVLIFTLYSLKLITKKHKKFGNWSLIHAE